MTNCFLPCLVLIPMVSALACYLIGRVSKKVRDIAADICTAAEFVLLCLLLVWVVREKTASASLPRILSGLNFEADGFRALYALIAGFMWLMTTIFSRQYLSHYRNRNRYYFFVLLTFGATLGVFLSADLLTTFVFFEIMSFTSYVMVIHDENEPAMRSGQTYLAVAVLGGMVMLMGLFLLYRLIGTLRIAELTAACARVPNEKRGQLYLAGVLILFGFGAKAGMYPLHIWLPKAHPVAPAPASALLSGILTKAGIFGVLVLSCRIFLHDAAWGTAILTLGVITMFTGAALAVFSVNLKRTLACSSVSQIGFILVGIGMQGLLGYENTLAVWGTELHMVNHSMLKLALFMSAGAIYMNLHKLNLNDIRGFGRGKPFLTAVFLVGCFGLAGVPLLNGYISKTLLHESIVEYIELIAEAGGNLFVLKAVEWIFLISGGLTAAYMTKLFVAVFVEKNADPAVQKKYDGLNHRYMNKQSAFALGVPALAMILMGTMPSFLMAGMACLGQDFMSGESPAHAIEWFSLTNLKGSGISLLIGAGVYLLFIRPLLMKDNGKGQKTYVDAWPTFVDIEERLYRPLCSLLGKAAVAVSSCFAWLGDVFFPKVAVFVSTRFSTAVAWLGDEFLPKIASFAALLIGKLFSSIPDGIVSLLHRTVLRKIPIPDARPSDYEEDDLRLKGGLPEEEKNVLNSFSYGLILFGIGLCAMLIFLLEHVLG